MGPSVDAGHVPPRYDAAVSTADIRAAGQTLRRAFHALDRAEHRQQERDPRDARPACGARCRDGHACTARVVWVPGEALPRKRCRLHGGLSTGPRTVDGLRRSLANLRHVDPAESPTLRAATGGVSWGDGCESCAARQRETQGVVNAARREGREVDVALVLCTKHLQRLRTAAARGRLTFTVR